MVISHTRYERSCSNRPRNSIEKSTFRKSTPCFQGSISVSAGREGEDFVCTTQKRASAVFHGVLAHAFSASFRTSFRGKTEFLPIFSGLRNALILENKGSSIRHSRSFRRRFDRSVPDARLEFCFTAVQDTKTAVLNGFLFAHMNKHFPKNAGHFPKTFERRKPCR